MPFDRSRFSLFTDRLETVFKCLFFLYASMTFNCVTFGTPLISLVMWPTFLLGALLILNRIAQINRYHTPHMWWLVGLLAAGALSFVCNLQYDLKMNLLYLITWAFYFLLLYIQPHDKSEHTFKKEARLFAFLYTAVAEICVIVSIGMLFSGYSLRETFEGGQLLGGFVDSRLYGMFIDPNAGATCAAVAGLFLVAAMRRYRRWWQRLLLTVGAILNLFYMALSDSRTGMVVIFAVAFVYTLLYLMRRLKEHRLMPLFAFCAAFIIAFGCFWAPTMAKKGYNSGVELWAVMKAESEKAPHEPPLTEEEKQAIIDSLIVHRDYDLSGDISNRRFSVWQSGWEIFVKRPLVGTTYTGFTEFAHKHLPQTYIVNNDYRDMITFDNEIINTMVSSGLAGLIPLFGFAIGLLMFLFRRVTRIAEHDTYMLAAACLAAVIGIACSAMFRSAILYYISSNSVLFWLLLGVLAMLCKQVPLPERNGETRHVT